MRYLQSLAELIALYGQVIFKIGLPVGAIFTLIYLLTHD